MDGFLCKLCNGAEIGDVVAIVDGCTIPLVLRRAGDGGEEGVYRLVGQGLVHAVGTCEELFENGVHQRLQLCRVENPSWMNDDNQ